MAVHRAKIGEAHILEHTAMEHCVFDRLLGLVGDAVQPAARRGCASHPPVHLFELQILRFQALLGQMTGHAAYIFGNGHPVVIEDHHQLFPALPRVG